MIGLHVLVVQLFLSISQALVGLVDVRDGGRVFHPQDVVIRPRHGDGSGGFHDCSAALEEMNSIDCFLSDMSHTVCLSVSRSEESDE